jgi:hypothetical protein
MKYKLWGKYEVSARLDPKCAGDKNSKCECIFSIHPSLPSEAYRVLMMWHYGGLNKSIDFGFYMENILREEDCVNIDDDSLVSHQYRHCFRGNS